MSSSGSNLTREKWAEKATRFDFGMLLYVPFEKVVDAAQARHKPIADHFIAQFCSASSRPRGNAIIMVGFSAID